MPSGRQNVRKLTDSSGGTASTTDEVVNVPVSYSEATFANIVATLVAKINELAEVVGHEAG